MKKLTSLLCVSFLLVGLAFGNMWGSSSNCYKEALDSTCYIQVDACEINEETKVPEIKPAIATGVVISEDDDNYFILTAGHLLKNNTDGICLLRFPSVKTLVLGQVVYSECVYPDDYKYRIPGDDIGIIAVPKSVGWLRTQPLDLSRPSSVFTIGCARGEHPSIVLSDVIEFMPGSFRINFRPLQGRSGSGVFSDKGLVGIVLTVDGGCTDAEKIKKVLDCVNPTVDNSGFLTIIRTNVSLVALKIDNLSKRVFGN